jgi:hypothetical protein
MLVCGARAHMLCSKISALAGFLSEASGETQTGVGGGGSWAGAWWAGWCQLVVWCCLESSVRSSPSAGNLVSIQTPEVRGVSVTPWCLLTLLAVWQGTSLVCIRPVVHRSGTAPSQLSRSTLSVRRCCARHRHRHTSCGTRKMNLSDTWALRQHTPEQSSRSSSV